MNSGQSLHALELMRKLVDREINIALLVEFYEEVVENETVFSNMVEDISSRVEIEERQKSVQHIESFCILLKELQTNFELLVEPDRCFLSEEAKREDMIDNASRFIDMLENECNIESPSDTI